MGHKTQGLNKVTCTKCSIDIYYNERIPKWTHEEVKGVTIFSSFCSMCQPYDAIQKIKREMEQRDNIQERNNKVTCNKQQKKKGKERDSKEKTGKYGTNNQITEIEKM